VEAGAGACGAGAAPGFLVSFAILFRLLDFRFVAHVD